MYKHDPRATERHYGGQMYVRECNKLAKQDGILADLLFGEQEMESNE